MQHKLLRMWILQTVHADSEKACFCEHSDTVEQAGLVMNHFENVDDKVWQVVDLVVTLADVWRMRRGVGVNDWGG